MTPKKRAFWIALSILPLLLFVGLRLYPAADSMHDAPVFHFYIVTFTSFTALVSALFVASAVERHAEPRVFFITMAFAAIAAVFLLHALATPGVILPGFNQAVGWSARLSLFAGALLFALSAIDWSPRAAEVIMSRRTALWVVAATLYVLYALIAFASPAPLAQLSSMEPWINYSLASLAVGLFLWSAWRAATKPRPGSDRLWTAISISLILLSQAQISMVLGPLWHMSWWLYHALMLVGFFLSVIAIAIEHEALADFQATRYFAALGGVIAFGLALLSGGAAAWLMGDPDMQVPFVGITLTVSTMLFVALFLIVRRAGAMLEERTQALRDEQQLRADLTRLVVHDLKNPLAAIIATLSALGEAGDRMETETRIRLLDSALNSAGDMEGLLDDMLDYERLEGGVLTPQNEMVCLDDLLTDRARALQSVTHQFGQTLSLELSERLPQVQGDPDLLARVIDNLLGNAVKFSGSGGTIRIAAYQSNGNAQVDVLDDGPGIDPSERERIFDRYYRGSNTGRRGAGLGLSFCQMVLDAHGGRIWADASPGGGAAFHFSLPIDGAPKPSA